MNMVNFMPAKCQHISVIITDNKHCEFSLLDFTPQRLVLGLGEKLHSYKSEMISWS